MNTDVTHTNQSLDTECVTPPGFSPLLDLLEQWLCAGVSELIVEYTFQYEWDCESTVKQKDMRLDVTVARPDIITLKFSLLPGRVIPTWSQLHLSFHCQGLMEERILHHDRKHKRDTIDFEQWMYHDWCDKPALVNCVEKIPSLYPKESFIDASIVYADDGSKDPPLDCIVMKMHANAGPGSTIPQFMWKYHPEGKLSLQFSIFGSGLDFREK
jgi:hypothetical protein